MPYIHKIFEKATIRSVADYLLFGLGPDEDTRDYEERLDELYNKFEEAVRKYDSNPTSELLDLSNELTSETASVYTEIGLQLGMLLFLDMTNNYRQVREMAGKIAGKEDRAKSILNKLYHIQQVSDLQETLINDKEYQKAEQEIKESAAKLKSILPDGIMQDLFEKIENKARMYGKAAYEQGFHDAVHVLDL